MLTDNFLPSLGGVERHIYTLARYMSKLSHEVHVVTSPSQNPNLDFQLDGDIERSHKIKVLRALPKATPLPIYNTVKYLLYCRKVVKYINRHANNYDVIHYHGTHQLFLRIAKSKRPIITSVHGIFPACVLQSPKPCEKRSVASCAICDISQKPEHIPVLPIMIPYYFSYYKLMKESLNYVNKVVCVSEYVRKYIKNALNLNNLIMIYNFIDFEEEIKPELTSITDFDVRNHLGLPSNARIITYFGNLSFYKGVDLLIKAFKELHKNVSNDIYLVIGGDGPQRIELENMARDIGNVVFTGFIPRKIQLAIMAQSDLFVHPARYPDACPTAILEAMALGLPIVATRLGGIPELVIDGKGGYLVNPNSPTDLATKISTILSSETFRHQANAFNLKWSHRFDIAHLGPKIIKLYETTLV